MNIRVTKIHESYWTSYKGRFYQDSDFKGRRPRDGAVSQCGHVYLRSGLFAWLNRDWLGWGSFLRGACFGACLVIALRHLFF